MKRLLAVLFVFMMVFSSCLPLIEPVTMSDSSGSLDITKDITLAPGGTVDGVDISTIAGAAHAQNTDTNMGVLAVKPLALDGDKFVIRDSAAGDVFSTTTGAQLKTYVGGHTQNTDTHLTSDGATVIIDAGVIMRDLYTDRWMYNNSNTFFGIDTAGAGHLDDSGGGSNATGNTAYGNNTMRDITTGYDNVAVGANALLTNLTGYYNVAIGSTAAQAMTTAIHSTAIGYQSLANSTGSYNTGVGSGTLANSGTGTYNTAVGLQSLNSATGSRNTALGRWSGQFNTGSDNVFLGNQAGEDSGAESDVLYIDNSHTTTPLIKGDFSTNKITINEDLEVADDLTVNGTINAPGDAIIKTDGSSARDLTITTGAAKTMLLTTPVYEDLVVSMTNVKAPAANPPLWTIYKGSELPAFIKDATNILYFSTQIPHSYKEGTNIEFHIHLAYPDSGAGNSVWYFTYSWADIGSNFPTASNSGNVVIASPATTDRHQTAEMVAAIDGTGKAISSVLVCSISRIGANGSDTYDNSIYLVSGDFHYLKDTLGSRGEETK
jgi:hypothetical protein